MVIASYKKTVFYKGDILNMDKSGFWYVNQVGILATLGPFSSLKKAKNNVNRRLGCKEVK